MWSGIYRIFVEGRELGDKKACARGSKAAWRERSTKDLLRPSNGAFNSLPVYSEHFLKKRARKWRALWWGGDLSLLV